MRPRALEERGTYSLVRELIDRFKQLARKELELMRIEAAENQQRGREAALWGAASALLGVAATAAAVISLTLALGRWLPIGLVALLLLSVFALAATILLRVTLGRLRTAWPRRSLREARATLAIIRSLGASDEPL